jgi:Epoxide hydrolase N terminus
VRSSGTGREPRKGNHHDQSAWGRGCSKPLSHRRAGRGSRDALARQGDGRDSAQGVPLAPIQELARYWATDYDWRKCEAKLNALPQFMTEIDGLDIHFIRVRSKHENALPLVVMHGWPGSIPVAVSVFPGEQYEVPRSWAEEAYPNLSSRPLTATERPRLTRLTKGART